MQQLEARDGSEAAQQALEEFETNRPARVKKVRGESAPEESILYTEKSTAAYVAARMPAIYGALHRVMSEVVSATFSTNRKITVAIRFGDQGEITGW